MNARRRGKGEGSVFYRPDKKVWVAAFDFGVDEYGKRQRRSLYAKTRSELSRKITDLRAKSGGDIKPRAIGTVGQFVERWLEDEIKPDRARNTYALYEAMWRVHLKVLVGAKSLETFDVEDVLSLYRHLRHEGASANILNRAGIMLQRAFGLAVKRRIYPRANPFTLVDRPTYRPKDARFLTVDEARRFLTAARDDRYEALWVLALTAGLRLGELLGLQWADVGWNRRALFVQRSLIEIGTYHELAPTKTKGSKRLVDLGDLAIEALLRRRASADAEDHDSNMIFPSLSGGFTRRTSLRRKHFFPALQRAEIEHIRIHDLRHSMTSLGLAEGVSVKVLAERLGHSTTRLTQDRYSHVLPGLQRQAADLIDAIFASVVTDTRAHE